MYSSKEFWLYSTFLQIVASETLALGASDKNLSTVLNTQVKPKKSRMSLRTVLPKFLRVTNIRLFSSIDGLISNKHLWVIFPSKAYLKASNKTPQQQWLNEQTTTLHVHHTFNEQQLCTCNILFDTFLCFSLHHHDVKFLKAKMKF